MFSASIVDAAVRSCGRKLDRYRQAKQAAARTVLEAKTRVWEEEFGEAMEEDSSAVGLEEILANRPAPQKGEAVLCQHCLQCGGELLTSTEDIVGRWKKYFEDLLNPTDLPSNEEAEDGDSGGGLTHHPSQVTEVVQQAPRWQG
ncbi:hypothetical protein L3Q82_006077 [Scortum barcoo]|uniref:Uncharacterized protein n=1 Tax=Scortum barcoo TaxID=214431 RepID=A0ACB8X3W5_9TELE|nr:hypothetical protein L3Q82_006077 [Scortum barcoo]